MPTTDSAKKRLKQNKKHNLRNKTRKSVLKTQVKKFLSLLKEGNAETAAAELRLTVKKLDKSVAKGILRKNTANRKKSKLTKKLNQIKAASQQKA
ncbi:MAG: SSU ribosomal protein S20p [Candidatus Jettenia ecosi]|uniref:Small ribosomal subunit protein bS20 n=1 Tax=Candidatus Jettenia ecosi TaxID=2494326 RepID=A0A533QJ94_9BACT|nr:MAG: SSU ribosomal protein S20p [Candidatus Jettenia ecosi]